MTLKEKINADFTAAFKAKETFKKDTLGGLKAKITEAEKKDNRSLADDEIYSVIATMIKQRDQAIEVYKTNESEQAKINAQKELDEKVILQSYLPAQMTDVEFTLEIARIIRENHVSGEDLNVKKFLGLIMKEFSTNYKGRYDGKRLKELLDLRLK